MTEQRLKRMTELYKEFAFNEELRELIGLITEFDAMKKEEYYMENFGYPEQRNLLGVMETTLEITKNHMKEDNKEEGMTDEDVRELRKHGVVV